MLDVSALPLMLRGADCGWARYPAKERAILPAIPTPALTSGSANAGKICLRQLTPSRRAAAALIVSGIAGNSAAGIAVNDARSPAVAKTPQ